MTTTTYTKTGDSKYDAHLDGELLGTIEKKRQRTNVMANDRGLRYSVGHTERTIWNAYRPGDSRPTAHSTRKDAAYWLAFLAEQAAKTTNA